MDGRTPAWKPVTMGTPTIPTVASPPANSRHAVTSTFNGALKNAIGAKITPTPPPMHAEPTASTKFTNNGKKSSSSGFKIKGLKKLQYKLYQNHFFDLKNDTLHYVFKFQF